MTTGRMRVRGWMWRWGIAVIAVPLALHGGCSCYGPDPDTAYCSSFAGSPISSDELPWCLSTAIIGKNDKGIIVSIPRSEALPDSPKFRVLTDVYSIALDGNIELLREFDFVPQAIASNGQQIAWVSADQTALMVADRDDPDGWVGVQMTPGQYTYDGEYILRLDMISSHLAVEIGNGSEDHANIHIFDVSARTQTRELSHSGYGWSLSDQWLALADWREDLFDVSADGYGIDVKLYSVADDQIIDVVQIPVSNTGFQMQIDQTTEAVYWTESDPVPSPNNGPPVRLMRWDYVSHEVTTEDTEFESHLLGGDYRYLAGVDNGQLVGSHSRSIAIQVSYFVRSPEGVDVEVPIMQYPDWHDVSSPVLVNGAMVWLENEQRKVIIFDPQSQLTSQIDFPAD